MKNKVFDREKFAMEMILHRINKARKSLNDCAMEIGISRSTLDRIETKETTPDVNTLYRCCVWLKRDMEKFFSRPQ